jgi:hypothetical protein
MGASAWVGKARFGKPMGASGSALPALRERNDAGWKWPRKGVAAFCADLTATQAAVIPGLNCNRMNRWFRPFPKRIRDHQSGLRGHFRGRMKVDESWFGAARPRQCQAAGLGVHRVLRAGLHRGHRGYDKGDDTRIFPGPCRPRRHGHQRRMSRLFRLGRLRLRDARADHQVPKEGQPFHRGRGPFQRHRMLLERHQTTLRNVQRNPRNLRIPSQGRRMALGQKPRHPHRGTGKNAGLEPLEKVWTAWMSARVGSPSCR